MKTRTSFYGLSAIALVAFIALFCASPSNPRTEPGNAKITAFNTNFKGGDTAFVPICIVFPCFTIPYRCTLDIQLPELTDSLIIKRKMVDSIVLATALTAADTQFRFSFTSHRFGRDTLVAYIVRKRNAGNDTMLKPYFSPSLYIRLQSKCALDTGCNWFDTLWADTCAFDRDSVADPSDIASGLWWPDDTTKGHVYRIVKTYRQICLPVCFNIWNRRWIVQYNDRFAHLCSQTGLDTLMWKVVNSDGDTVTQPLILKRSATCP